MVSGISQRHVAVLLTRARCHATAFSPLTVSGANRPCLQRRQSTVTRDATASGDSQSVTSHGEIPADSFVDLPSFPQPSFQRLDSSDQFDLATTRPATIESPPPLERRDYKDENIPLKDRVKYLFRLGKGYLAFYKTGLKNIWSNSKHYREINGRLQGHSLNTVARYGGQTINGKTIPNISRTEYQLSLRTKHDLLKMLPFSLVFIICGEFTPLVIIALGSSVVPYTCRIPQQTDKDMRKKTMQDQDYMQDLSQIHPELESPLEGPDWQVEHLEAYRLGLTSIRKPIPVIGPLYHAIRTRPRLIRHCNNLVSDTILIHRQGGPFKLSPIDLYEWADAYGMYAFRRYIEECQKKGKDPKTENLKTTLLPHIDGEMRYMLEKVADWAKLKPEEQWRVGLRTVGSHSPDWQARVRKMRQQWTQA